MPSSLGLGGRELVVVRTPWAWQAGQLLELGRGRVDRCGRRCRRGAPGPAAPAGVELRLLPRLLLRRYSRPAAAVGLLVGVLLLLVVADGAGRAGDNGRRGRHTHEAGASASHHRAVPPSWLRRDGFVGRCPVDGRLDDVVRDALDVDQHAARVARRRRRTARPRGPPRRGRPPRSSGRARRRSRRDRRRSGIRPARRRGSRTPGRRPSPRPRARRRRRCRRRP